MAVRIAAADDDFGGDLFYAVFSHLVFWVESEIEFSYL